MSEDFATQEIVKIFKNKKYEYPLNVAMASTWILANLKGSDLKILDVGKKSSLADYFVIASAGNPTQAGAMADQIGFFMKHLDVNIKSVEGKNNSDWILIDLGDVIVHIFQENIRHAYDLETLYASATPVAIPEEYYFSETAPIGKSTAKKGKEDGDDENYF